MDDELRQKIEQIEKRLDDIQKYNKRTYSIMVWTAIIGIALFVLPLIGLVFIVPSFIGTYTGMTSIQY